MCFSSPVLPRFHALSANSISPGLYSVRLLAYVSLAFLLPSLLLLCSFPPISVNPAAVSSVQISSVSHVSVSSALICPLQLTRWATMAHLCNACSNWLHHKWYSLAPFPARQRTALVSSPHSKPFHKHAGAPPSLPSSFQPAAIFIRTATQFVGLVLWADPLQHRFTSSPTLFILWQTNDDTRGWGSNRVFPERNPGFASFFTRHSPPRCVCFFPPQFHFNRIAFHLLETALARSILGPRIFTIFTRTLEEARV